MKKFLSSLLRATLTTSTLALGNSGIHFDSVERSPSENAKKAEERKKNCPPQNAPKEFCGDNLTWRFVEDKATLVIDGEGEMWDFVVWNEKYKEYRIGKAPWDSIKHKIENVALGNGVTSIGDNAFQFLTHLQSRIYIPTNITYIGEMAFAACSLKDIIVSDSNQSYTDCDGVLFTKDMKKLVFYPTDKPQYNRCYIIPPSVTSIGAYAFLYCDSLMGIMIPDKVASIEEGAFCDCRSLKAMLVDENNKHFTSVKGIVFTKNMKKIVCCPADYTDTAYSIPEGVTTIGAGAFESCFFEEIVIPNSVTLIDKKAFKFTSLKSITIPDNVTFIGEEAFSHCNELESINVSEGNKSYTSKDGVLFTSDMKKLICYPALKTNHEYCIPEGVTSIGKWAFYECKILKSLTIPSSVTSIGEGAFYRCQSLESITIPNSITYIDDESFSFCFALKSIIISDSVTSIGNEAFSFCRALESITLPESVISIGDMAFCECSALTSVTIPDSITHIGEDVFDGCSSLQTTDLANYEPIASIPDDDMNNFTTSDDETFFEGSCGDNLTWRFDEDKATLVIEGKGDMWNFYSSSSEVSMPWYRYLDKIEHVLLCDGVTSVGELAFFHCKYIASVNIPASVTFIGAHTFYCSEFLKCVTVDKDNKNYTDNDGVLFTKDMKKLLYYPEGKPGDDYIIPNGVTSIEEYAFHSCRIKSIRIPDGVTSIGSNAFSWCSSLISVHLPDSVTYIGMQAFESCHNLKSATLSRGCASINIKAFNDCTALANVIIPDGVTSIEDEAFCDCESLTSVNIPDSVTSIKNDAFCGCNSLASINIPDGVTTIADGVFYCCDALTSINIPNGVTYIGDYAFGECISLKSVNIPENVTTIGEQAFSCCDSLETIHFAGKKKQWKAFNIPREDINNATIIFQDD